MTLTVAFLGPRGHVHGGGAAGLRAGGRSSAEPRTTIYETVMAVQRGETDRAVVPIENSLEGGVAATLDALAGRGRRVRIVAEVVHPIHHNLIARPGHRARRRVARVLSHPPRDGAVRALPEPRAARRRAAAGRPPPPRRCALVERVGRAVGRARLARWPPSSTAAACWRREVEDRAGQPDPLRVAGARRRAERRRQRAAARPRSCSGASTTSRPARWSSVLRELSDREINLTKIESRPRRVRLGHYMFFADLDGPPRRAARGRGAGGA